MDPRPPTPEAALVSDLARVGHGCLKLCMVVVGILFAVALCRAIAWAIVAAGLFQC